MFSPLARGPDTPLRYMIGDDQSACRREEGCTKTFTETSYNPSKPGILLDETQLQKALVMAKVICNLTVWDDRKQTQRPVRK